MPQTEYLVKARAKSGRLVESKMKAASESEALSRMRQQGLTPIAVEATNTGLNMEIRFGKGKVKSKDLAIFSRQFATMLSSGLPILRCLSILSEQTESRRLGELLVEVRDEVEKGDSLSESLAQHKEFPPIMVSMVRAGEVGGFLDTTMLQIADSLEADVRLRGKIKSALTYPIAVGRHRRADRHRHAHLRRAGVLRTVRGVRRRPAAAHADAGHPVRHRQEPDVLHPVPGRS